MHVHMARGLAVLLLITAVLASLPRGLSGNDPDALRIAELIKQLGSNVSSRRTSASKELMELGGKALPALRKAALQSTDIETRRRAQELVRALMPTSYKSKSTSLEMVLVEAGDFQMGSPQNETARRADEPQHRVSITKPFYLGVFEVTQDEYQKVTGTNPSWFAKTGGGKDAVAGLDTARFPVERVTWFDAIEFCNRLSKKDGLDPYYQLADIERDPPTPVRARVTILGGAGYRLPTEAEWEYACREWSLTAFHFGQVNTGKQANLKAGIVVGGYGGGPRWKSLNRTAQVGSFPPSRWRLHDMHGNVGEWCWDYYDEGFYPKSPTADPIGPKAGVHRVVRGGSWLVTEGSGRSASRASQAPEEARYHTGFRVARNP